MCSREKVLEVVRPLNDEDVMDYSIMFTKVCTVGKTLAPFLAAIIRPAWPFMPFWQKPLNLLRRSWPHKSEDDMHNMQYFAQFSFIKFFFFHFIFSMIYGKTYLDSTMGIMEPRDEGESR